MFLAGIFLAAVAHSLASPVPVTVPGGPIPSPLCVVAAAVAASQCDPTRRRTIFDILNSCIGVILLCTYISIHTNIPDQNDGWAKAAWLKLRTTLYALAAPEMVIMWAIRQRIMAGRIARENKDRGWTRTHSFFVQMGGLMQRTEKEGEVVYRVAGVTMRDDPHIDWAGIKIPRIPEKEIKDRGKGDLLAKAIVVVQATWFVAQCIARHIQGHVLTEIKLVTLAFATLNVITYGLWWDKPLNVGYPIYFDENGNRIDGPEEIKSANEASWYQGIWERLRGYFDSTIEAIPRQWSSHQERNERSGVLIMIWEKGFKRIFFTIFSPLLGMMMEEGGQNKKTSVHPFYAAAMEADDLNLAIIYGSIVGIIFGGIHLIAWNFQFPTATELWLWRAFSLVLTIIPLLLAASSTTFLAFHKTDNSSLQKIYRLIGRLLEVPAILLGAPLYFAARIVILFLALFTLRNLSDSAYANVRWTEFIPHI
ncbi:hypothetical protein AX16_002217 [Volvariella volvacea WC 439]|nr:hypothetical protein AX16_002217 [Volvariella volvacea WC 439]